MPLERRKIKSVTAPANVGAGHLHRLSGAVFFSHFLTLLLYVHAPGMLGVGSAEGCWLVQVYSHWRQIPIKFSESRIWKIWKNWKKLPLISEYSKFPLHTDLKQLCHRVPQVFFFVKRTAWSEDWARQALWKDSVDTDSLIFHFVVTKCPDNPVCLGQAADQVHHLI